jgi:hypothetical protein
MYSRSSSITEKLEIYHLLYSLWKELIGELLYDLYLQQLQKLSSPCHSLSGEAILAVQGDALGSISERVTVPRTFD